MNFENGNYVSAYSSMFHSADTDGGFITKDDYDSGYSVFQFKLAPEEEGGSMPLVNTANLRIVGTFQKALLKNIVVIVLARFPDIISVDKARNVTI